MDKNKPSKQNTNSLKYKSYHKRNLCQNCLRIEAIDDPNFLPKVGEIVIHHALHVRI